MLPEDILMLDEFDAMYFRVLLVFISFNYHTFASCSLLALAGGLPMVDWVRMLAALHVSKCCLMSLLMPLSVH